MERQWFVSACVCGYVCACVCVGGGGLHARRGIRKKMRDLLGLTLDVAPLKSQAGTFTEPPEG